MAMLFVAIVEQAPAIILPSTSLVTLWLLATSISRRLEQLAAEE